MSKKIKFRILRQFVDSGCDWCGNSNSYTDNETDWEEATPEEFKSIEEDVEYLNGGKDTKYEEECYKYRIIEEVSKEKLYDSVKGFRGRVEELKKREEERVKKNREKEARISLAGKQRKEKAKKDKLEKARETLRKLEEDFGKKLI